MSTTRRPIAFGIALGLLACGALAQPQAPAAERTLFRAIYQELVEINTTDSVGDNTQAARAMAARLKAGGFTDAEMQVLVPAGAPKKGNLVEAVDVNIKDKYGANAWNYAALAEDKDVSQRLKARLEAKGISTKGFDRSSAAFWLMGNPAFGGAKGYFTEALGALCRVLVAGLRDLI